VRPGRPDPNDAPGHSAGERIEALGEKVHARLDALARKTGMDFSEVGAAFDQNMERLMAGLADGSLSRDGLAQGVGNMLDQLREDVSGRMNPGGDRLDRPGPSGPEARLEAVASSIEGRVQALADELGGAKGAGLEKALDAFGGHMDRLVAGLEDGSLGRDELASGLQNVLDLVRSDVQRGLGEGERGRRSEAPAGGLEQRFESFVSGVEERLAGVDASPRQAEALAQLKADFGAAMDRLGSAFFDQGSIGRGQFQDLFGSLLSDLREDVQGLFGDQQDSGRASIYHPVRGVEHLGGGMPGGLDATV
jgi:hypothetical protein